MSKPGIGSPEDPLVYEIDDLELRRGRPSPLGATLLRGGVNFAVFSRHATRVTLLLFAPGADEPVEVFRLDPRFNRTGSIWHAYVKGVSHGVEYAYVMDREHPDKKHLHRFDPKKVLIDPYARAISGGEVWGAIVPLPVVITQIESLCTLPVP